MESLINISNLTIGYQKCAIISNISVTAMPNEMICIIGRNGQGKSTLIKTLCKLLPPISGSVDINQQNLLKLNDNEFSKLISVVLTSKITIYNTSVKEFVAYGRYPYTNWIGKLTDKDQEIIDYAITLCDINHLINRDFDSLSDGEKQKVNIARAIAQQTPIIILDEPTAHLDLVNNMEIFKLLQHLAHNFGKTIIFSTHHMEIALQLSDKIWVVNNHSIHADCPAKIVEEGVLNELFKNTNVIFNSSSQTFELRT